MPKQHGYWDKDGNFIPTETYAEAVDAWRSQEGYSTGGVYQTTQGIVDTRGLGGGGTVVPAIQEPPQPVVPNVAGLYERRFQTGALGASRGTSTIVPLTAQEQRLTAMESRLEPTIPTLRRRVNEVYNIQDVQTGVVAEGQRRQLGAEASIQAQARGTNVQYTDPRQAFADVPLDVKLARNQAGRWIRMASAKISGALAFQGPSPGAMQPEGTIFRQGQAIEPTAPTQPGRWLGVTDAARQRAGAARGTVEVDNSRLPVSNTEGTPSQASNTLPISPEAAAILNRNSQVRLADAIASAALGIPSPYPIPQNILMSFGEEQDPNEAMASVQKLIVDGLRELGYAQADSLGALSTEEFFSLMGYKPTEANPNIWSRTGDALNLTEPNDVAASILGAEQFYDPYLGSGLGGLGGAFYGAAQPSARPSVGSNYGFGSVALYLWRISA